MNYNISFSYKKKDAIFNNFELELPESKITVLCGHNGAGKTTLLKIIKGILPSNITNSSGWFVSASGGLIQHFSLKEHLDILNIKSEQLSDTNSIIHKAISLFKADVFFNKRISRLSTGQAMICAIIVALASNEKLLLLDEPFGPLDPANAQLLSELLKETANQGKTILITSHDLYLTAETADKIIFIRDGKISYTEIGSGELPFSVEHLQEMYKVYA